MRHAEHGTEGTQEGLKEQHVASLWSKEKAQGRPACAKPLQSVMFKNPELCICGPTHICKCRDRYGRFRLRRCRGEQGER